jgi:hypothetical protein
MSNQKLKKLKFGGIENEKAREQKGMDRQGFLRFREPIFHARDTGERACADIPVSRYGKNGTVGR